MGGGESEIRPWQRKSWARDERRITAPCPKTGKGHTGAGDFETGAGDASQAEHLLRGPLYTFNFLNFFF